MAASSRADQLATDAAKAVERGDLDTARKLLLESMALKASFDTVGNLGAVELAQKRYRDCAEHLALSLRSYPPTGSEAAKKRTQDKLTECKKKVGVAAVTVSPEGVTIAVDGATVGRAPLADSLYLEPGSHVLTFTKEGHRSEARTLSAVAGGEETIQLSLTPTPARPSQPVVATSDKSGDAASSHAASPTAAAGDAAPVPPSSSAPFWPVIAGGATTVVMLGTGVGLWVASTSTEKEGDALKTSLREAGKVCPADCGELIDTYERASSQRNAATGMFVSAGVLAAGTAAYYLIVHPSPGSTSTALIPIVDRDRAGLVLSGSF